MASPLLPLPRLFQPPAKPKGGGRRSKLDDVLDIFVGSGFLQVPANDAPPPEWQTADYPRSWEEARERESQAFAPVPAGRLPKQLPRMMGEIPPPEAPLSGKDLPKWMKSSGASSDAFLRPGPGELAPPNTPPGRKSFGKVRLDSPGDQPLVLYEQWIKEALRRGDVTPKQAANMRNRLPPFHPPEGVPSGFIPGPPPTPEDIARQEATQRQNRDALRQIRNINRLANQGGGPIFPQELPPELSGRKTFLGPSEHVPRPITEAQIFNMLREGSLIPEEAARLRLSPNYQKPPSTGLPPITPAVQAEFDFLTGTGDASRGEVRNAVRQGGNANRLARQGLGGPYLPPMPPGRQPFGHPQLGPLGPLPPPPPPTPEQKAKQERVQKQIADADERRRAKEKRVQQQINDANKRRAAKQEKIHEQNLAALKRMKAKQGMVKTHEAIRNMVSKGQLTPDEALRLSRTLEPGGPPPSGPKGRKPPPKPPGGSRAFGAGGRAGGELKIISGLFTLDAAQRVMDAYSDAPEERGVPSGNPALGYRKPFESMEEWAMRVAPYISDLGGFVGRRASETLGRVRGNRVQSGRVLPAPNY